MTPYCDPAALLPHEAPMVLLDEVLSAGQEGAVAALTIQADDRFVRAGLGVPAHVALEWMAQTCGVFAGHEAVTARTPVRQGLLLGTRRFQAARAWFMPGERLTVHAALVLREAGMGVFDCTVYDAAGIACAVAQLTTYQPPVEEA